MYLFETYLGKDKIPFLERKKSVKNLKNSALLS